MATPSPTNTRQPETTTVIVNDQSGATTTSTPDGIPPEVNKIIEQDLAKNPLQNGGERVYRVVINRNLTSPGQDAQVVRVIVRSEGRPTTVIHQTPLPPSAPVVSSQPRQSVHYILPPIEPVGQVVQTQTQTQQEQQPHRYTPPPHKSIILPSANATSRMSNHDDQEKAKSKKKVFSFFN